MATKVQQPSGRDEAAQGTIDDSEHAELHRTEQEGPAQPSDEAEARNRSPAGGRSFDSDLIAVDPVNAPTAHAFLVRLTAAMLMVVLFIVLASVTASPVVLLAALATIIIGLSTVLMAVFQMMSGD